MASNHLTTKPVARAKGGSAVHSAAYILRTRIYDERMGRVWDYSRKADDVLWSGRFIPKGAAGWMMDSGQMWNGAEQAENKINARTGRVVQMGLHSELTLEQNQRLLTDFIRENFTRKGIAAEVAIHRADANGDERNIHAHILLATRFAGADGLAAKDRDSNRVDVLKSWRDDWEKRSNKAFQRYGIEAQISMQTLASQGIDRTPETHLGKTAAALERKGIDTDRGDDLREARAENRVRRLLEQAAPEQALVTAIDRLRAEETAIAKKEAERDLARGSSVAAHARDLLSAVRRLFVTMGGTLGNVITVDRGDLRGQGRTLRTEAVEERRRLVEDLAAAPAVDNHRNPIPDQEQKPQKVAARAVPEAMPEATQRASVEVEKSADLQKTANRPTLTPEPVQQRETLRDRLRREAAEQGHDIEVVLRPHPARRMERTLEIARPRRPEDDEFTRR